MGPGIINYQLCDDDDIDDVYATRRHYGRDSCRNSAGIDTDWIFRRQGSNRIMIIIADYRIKVLSHKRESKK